MKKSKKISDLCCCWEDASGKMSCDNRHSNESWICNAHGGKDLPRWSGRKADRARLAQTTLPSDSKARKDVPLATGCLDYFPAALAAVAALSKAGNDKHNPGQPLHWSRAKSSDHADCLQRHFLERGTVDPEDGISHSVKLVWRALALLQIELEAAGAPLARGARLPEDA